jgi:hypothetical protein
MVEGDLESLLLTPFGGRAGPRAALTWSGGDCGKASSRELVTQDLFGQAEESRAEGLKPLANYGFPHTRGDGIDGGEG